MALTFDDAVEITRIKPDAAGHEGYGMERRPYLMRDGSAATVKVSVHPDPMPPQRDVGAALAALSQEDLLRLRAIARPAPADRGQQRQLKTDNPRRSADRI